MLAGRPRRAPGRGPPAATTDPAEASAVINVGTSAAGVACTSPFYGLRAVAAICSASAAPVGHDPPGSPRNSTRSACARDQVVGDHRDRLTTVPAGGRQQRQHLTSAARIQVAGSSAISRSVAVANARAIATAAAARRRLVRACRSRCVQAQRRGQPSTRRVRPPSGWCPPRSKGSRMLPSASRVDTRLNDWNTEADPRRRRTVSSASSSPVISVSPSQAHAGRRGVQAGDDVHQGGLPGPGRAHDRGELAATDHHVHPGQRVHRALSGAVGLDQRMLPGRRRRVV